MKVFKKSDEDVRDYFLDLRRWMPAGDEITSVDISHEGGGEITVQGYNFSENAIKVWIAGGVKDKSYTFKVLAHTGAGRTKEITFMMVVTER